MSMEDLLGALSDYLLQSGFQDSSWYEMPEGEQTLEDLKRSDRNALMNGEMFDEEHARADRTDESDGQLDELIEQLIERMQQEEYISVDEPHDPSRHSSVGGQTGRRSRPSSKSRTRAWIFSASSRCATCSVRWANRASDGTIPAIWRPESRPADAPELRIRRHAESRHHGDAVKCHPARRTDAAAEHRIFRPAGASMRISVFLRDRADARLLAFDDSLW